MKDQYGRIGESTYGSIVSHPSILQVVLLRFEDLCRFHLSMQSYRDLEAGNIQVARPGIKPLTPPPAPSTTTAPL